MHDQPLSTNLLREIIVQSHLFFSYLYKHLPLSFTSCVQVGQVCVMIHSGSRGLGHQVATDALVAMETAMARDGLITNDRQLACARINSQVILLVMSYHYAPLFVYDSYQISPTISVYLLCPQLTAAYIHSQHFFQQH